MSRVGLGFLVPVAEPAGRLCSVWQASPTQHLVPGGVLARLLQAACFPSCPSETDYGYLKGGHNIYQKGIFQKKMYIYINRCCV